MAKIRVKQGNNEIEIDSRDFYVDNDSAAEIIESLKQQLQKTPKNDVMNSLDNAEFHEPEFSSPVNSFFDQPRTVSETVSQLTEYGWNASPFDVSVALTKMAFNKEFLKNTNDERNYYFSKEALLTN